MCLFRVCRSAKIIGVLLVMTLTLAASVAAPQDTAETQTHLSPLPSVKELEQAAKLAHMTLAKCEATASTYGEALTPQLITSIQDDQLHRLNTQAFACMQLGGKVSYGYQIKTVVDAVIAASGITTALQNQQRDTIKVTSGMLEKMVAHNNALVDKYNDLVAKHNDLLTKYQTLHGLATEAVNDAITLQRANNQMYAIATQALGGNWYSQPTAIVIPSMPSTVTVRQSPLHCTAQTIGAFTYTHCF